MPSLRAAGRGMSRFRARASMKREAAARSQPAVMAARRFLAKQRVTSRFRSGASVHNKRKQSSQRSEAAPREQTKESGLAAIAVWASSYFLGLWPACSCRFCRFSLGVISKPCARPRRGCLHSQLQTGCASPPFGPIRRRPAGTGLAARQRTLPAARAKASGCHTLDPHEPGWRIFCRLRGNRLPPCAILLPHLPDAAPAFGNLEHS